MTRIILRSTRFVAALRVVFGVLAAITPFAFGGLPDYTDGSTYPGAWPANWRPYTVNGQAVFDQTSRLDLTTGGTTPNGAVDLVGVGEPAAFYHADGENLYMRFRLDGPPLALSGSSQPYVSATWNVLIDTDADGFKEFAVMLEGMNVSSQPDDLRVMYNDDPVQTVDRLRDVVWVQDAAGGTTGGGDGSDGEPGGSAAWDLDDDEYVWDFGRTRVTQLEASVAPGSNKSAYYLDVQVPIEALDATSLGGEKLEPASIVRFAITTANSNTDPAQKDFAYLNGYTYGGPSDPLPPGDSIDLDGGGPHLRPIVSRIDVGSVCRDGGVTDLTARVAGRTVPLENRIRSRVEEVEFFYAPDPDQDGHLSADEEALLTWTSLGSVKLPADGLPENGDVDNGIGPWRMEVEGSALPQGHLLVKVVARDDDYVTDSLDHDPSSGTYNPATRVLPAPSFVYDSFLNTCGTASATLTKSVSDTTLAPGQEDVGFEVTISNPSGTPFVLDQLSDPLADGFAFDGMRSAKGFGEADVAPEVTTTAEGTLLTWTFDDLVVDPGTSKTLAFAVTGPAATGTYSNRVHAATSLGSLSSEAVEVSVGEGRLGLTIVPTLESDGSVAAAADPGASLVYTTTYRNDSAVNARGVSVVAELPPELVDVRSITSGGVLEDGRVTWFVGDLPSGDGPFELAFTADIVGPSYPAEGSPLLQVPATITAEAPQIDAVTATASTLVRAPRSHLILNVTTEGNVTMVPEDEHVTFVLSYTNAGHRRAEGATLTAAVPPGFQLVETGIEDAHGDFSYDASADVAMWTIGTIDAQSGGERRVVLQVTGEPDPEIFEGVLEADLVRPVVDDYLVGLKPSGDLADLCEERQVYWWPDPGHAEATFGAPAVVYAYASDEYDGAPEASSSTYVLDSAAAHWNNRGSGRHKNAYLVVRQDVTSTIGMDGALNVSFYLDQLRDQGSVDNLNLNLYAVTSDDPDGPARLLGTSALTISGNEYEGILAMSAELNVDEVEAGEKLELVLTRDKNGTWPSSQDFRIIRVGVDHFSHCYDVPQLVLDKHVDKPEVAPGETLEYLLNYRNVAHAAAPGAVLVDTLPLGVQLEGVSSISENETGASVVTPLVPAQGDGDLQEGEYAVDGRTVTVPLGTLRSEEKGTIVIDVFVKDEVPDGVAGFLNHASLSTTAYEAVPVEDKIYTALRRSPAPNLSISKRVDESLLVQGGRARYTVVVHNSGLEPAEELRVTDLLQISRAEGGHPLPHFSYVEGSFAAAVQDASGNIVSEFVAGEDWTYDRDDADAEATFVVGGDDFRLGSEQRLLISYDFQVGTSVPDGLHEFAGFATVEAAELDPVRSDDVVVTVSGNPNLRIGMHAELEEAPVGNGGSRRSVTYRICIANSGMTEAIGVTATSPIPDLGSFRPGTLQVVPATATTNLGRPACTARSGAVEDEFFYDADADRVRLVMASPLHHETNDARIIEYGVLVDEVLPDLENSLVGRAAVSALNASTKRATHVLALTARPDLRITKSGPLSVAFPLTRVASVESIAGPNTIRVDDPGRLDEATWVGIGGHVVRVDEIDGNRVVLSEAVSVPSGEPILPTFDYRIAYANQGSTVAESVTLSDALPEGLDYVASWPPDDGVSIDGRREWDLGALPAGEGGVVSIRVLPVRVGEFTNSATIASGSFSAESEPVTTVVGGFTIRKESIDKIVFPARDDVEAGRTTYTITIQNPLRIVDDTLHVTDVLPNGFRFVEMVDGGNARCVPEGDGDPVTEDHVGAEADPTLSWQVLEWSCDTGTTLDGRSPEEEIVLRFVAEADEYILALTYDNHVQVTSDVSSVVQFDGERSPLDDVKVSFDSGADIHGSVYEDADHDGTKDDGEDWSRGVTVRVNLINEDDGRVVSLPVEVSRGEGTFSFLGRPAANYSVVLTNSYVAVDPQAPVGWSFVAPTNGTIALSRLEEDDEVEDVDFGLFLGTHLKGRVFRDDGRSGGLANNVVPDGDEAPLANVNVSLRGSNGGVSMRTDDEGAFELYMPASWGTDVTVTHDAGIATGTRMDDTVDLVADYESATAYEYVVDNAAGGRRTLATGVVYPSSFTSDRTSETVSPGSSEYLHFFRPGTMGEVEFWGSGTLEGVGYEFFADADCDGAIEAEERVSGNTFVVDSDWKRAPDGRFESCMVEARVLVPHGVPPGRTDIATMTADFFWSGSDVLDVRSLTDVTTVRERVDLLLEATVRNASTGGPDDPGALAEAKPGEDLEYCVYYQNIGIRDLTEVRVNMPVPFHTDFRTEAYGESRDVKWTEGGVEAFAATSGERTNLTGRLLRLDVGDLTPAENGEACFRVTIR